MVMHRLFILFSLLSFSFFAKAQEVIKGIYNPDTHIFVPEANVLSGRRNTPYEVSEFHSGMGIITYNGRTGVIDSTGRVKIPLSYNKLEVLRNKSRFFKAEKEGKSYLLNENGKELLELKDPLNRCMFIAREEHSNVVVADVNHVGAFDVQREVWNVPLIYDHTPIYAQQIERARRNGRFPALSARWGVFRTNDKFVLHNLQSGEVSEAFDDIVVLADDRVYAKNKNELGKVVSAIQELKQPQEWDYLDYYRKMFVVMREDKMGVMSISNEMIIPLEYEDIRFIGEEAFWLKKEGKWALCNSDYELQSEFIYDDAEKMNQEFIDQALYLTKLDTTGRNLYQFRKYSGINEEPNDLKQLLLHVLQLEDTKRDFSCIFEDMNRRNYTFVKTQGKFTFLYVPFLELDKASYDQLFYLPDDFANGGMKGGRIGEKYQLNDGKEWYEGLMFDCKQMRMSCDNAGIVKKGHIYLYVIDYNSASQNCKWEKIIPYNEYTLK